MRGAALVRFWYLAFAYSWRVWWPWRVWRFGKRGWSLLFERWRGYAYAVLVGVSHMVAATVL